MDTCTDFAYKQLTIDGRLVHVQLWDISGDDRFGNLTSVYFRHAAGAFVSYDLSDPATRQQVARWKKELDDKTATPGKPPIPTVLLANKVRIWLPAVCSTPHPLPPTLLALPLPSSIFLPLPVRSRTAVSSKRGDGHVVPRTWLFKMVCTIPQFITPTFRFVGSRPLQKTEQTSMRRFIFWFMQLFKINRWINNLQVRSRRRVMYPFRLLDRQLPPKMKTRHDRDAVSLIFHRFSISCPRVLWHNFVCIININFNLIKMHVC